jgi:hypothetical protein
MMTTDDVLALLVYANELDGRHAPNDVKVLAWQEVINTEGRGMTLDFAKDQITRHYATTDVMLSPAVLVTGWRQKTRAENEARMSRQGGVERHCGRGGCVCTHTDECYKGWIDHDRGTDACPVCRPSLADAIHAMPDPGSRSDHDFATLRNRMWGNDE